MLVRGLIMLGVMIVGGAMLTSPAAAQQAERPDIAYRPHEGARVAAAFGPIDKNGARNVSIRQVEKDRAPEFIRNQMEIIARECTGNAANIDSIKAFEYISDRTRRLGIAPDYLLDMSGLKKKPQQFCHLGRACGKRTCNMLGYIAYGPSHWEVGFRMSFTKWKPQIIADRATGGNVGLLAITAPTNCGKTGALPARDPAVVAEDPDATEEDMAAAEEAAAVEKPDLSNLDSVHAYLAERPSCEEQYVWLGESLVPYNTAGLDVPDTVPVPTAAADQHLPEEVTHR